MNVLKIAQTVIRKDKFTYKQLSDRTLNEVGQYVNAYVGQGSGATPDNYPTLYGNLQPINKNLYEQMGLDLQKTYVTIHITSNLGDVDRTISGDEIVYNGHTYECLSKQQDWYSQRGFISILAVQIA